MSQQINEEISSILNGKTSTIIEQLETLRQEMNQEMNGHFEKAFKSNRIDFNVCKLHGVITANQKMVLLYLQNRRSASNVQMVRDTGMNRLTIYRSLEVLMDLNYVVKNRMTYEINQTKIY